MKKINFRTFKFQIVLLFLVMSVPAMGLALTASYTITREAQEQIIDARQNNMKILVNQYDASMESVINYVELLLFQDSSYVGLRFDESTTNYQQARIWLKDDLDKIKDYFPNISGFYVRVLKNDDCYMPKKRYKIDLETEEFLKQEIVKRKDEEKPIVVQYEDRQYLICGYKNSFLDIGFVVNLEDLEALFEESLAGGVLALEVHGDSEKVLLSSGEIENKNVLREDFATLDMSLLLYYSKADVANGIAAWKRTLLHGSILLFCLFPIFWFLIHKWFLKPMNRISWSMQEILRGNIDYRISKFSNTQEFSRIEEAFNRVLDYSRDLKIKIYEHEIAMEKEKLVNLRLQINPHLLLNSLNTISSLAVSGKTAEIQEFSLNLSKYFRYSLRNTSELVTVRSEIDFIKAYNKVQKIRYPNAFYLVYDVEEEIMEELIPPLIIQNFVENSTKYALKADTEIGMSTPGTRASEERILGSEVVQLDLCPTYMTTNVYTGVLFFISKNAQNPEKAMGVLNLLFTDPAFSNILANGEEGVDYTMVDKDNGVIAYNDGAIYTNMYGVWGDGSDWYITEDNGDPETVYQERKDYLADAVAHTSKAHGYKFNASELSTEQATVKSVISKYLTQLEYGTVDLDTTYPEFLDALDKAGINKIIEENQKQLDAWLAAQQ